VKEVDAGRAVLDSVQQLLSRLSFSSTANEIALVGVLPLGDRNRPLVVFHSQLRERGAEDMRQLLASGTFTRPTRQVHGHQVFRIGPDADAVEVALVARDLVVSNDSKAMEQTLDPRTAAGGGFAAGKRFQRLRRELDVPPGSLMFYADWQALRPRLGSLFGGDAAWVMQWSGVQVPEQLMFVARPAPCKPGQKRGIVTTFLLHHTSDSYKFSSTADAADLKSRRFDGWLDLLIEARPKALLAGLPRGGVATLSSMLDFKALLQTHRGKLWKSLQARYLRYANHVRLDLRADVLRRLEAIGGLQLMTVDDGGWMPRLAFSIQAKSPKKAVEVFDSLCRAFTGHGDAEERVAADGGRELHFPVDHQGRRLVLAAVHDTLVLAYDSSVMERVRAATTMTPRRAASLKKRDAAVLERLQRLGVSRQKKIAGLFALDFRELAGRLAPSGDGDQAVKRKPTDPLSGLLGVHGGLFSIDQDLIRLEVFTQH
jgi:hypothetical protein